jgi:hypothetical protein
MKRTSFIKKVCIGVSVVIFALIAGAISLFRIFAMPFSSVGFDVVQNHTNLFSIRSTIPDRTGMVFNYVKSNMDGSNATQEWVYYPNPIRSESFKIYGFARHQRATDLVCADYDMGNFQVQHILAYLIDIKGNRKLNAEGVIEGSSLFKQRFHGDYYSFSIGTIPSFNYNFDWVDLITMYPYLINKNKDFTTGILVPNSMMKFVYAGTVRFSFIGTIPYDGKPCRKYTVTIEGFEKKPGYLYADIDTDEVREISVPIQNNPSLYTSFKYKLIGKSTMSSSAWDSFIRDKTVATLK